MSKLKIKYLGDILGITFPDDIEITHATNSTKKVKKNSIFFGLQGTKVHGSKYIEEAIELGASVAVHDDPNFKINNQDLKNKIFYIEDIDKPWTEAKESQKYFIEAANKFDDIFEEIGDSYNLYNKLLIFLCELYSDCRFVSSISHEYNIPAFYGFTGTNGKTTSANIACQLENSIYPKGRGIYIGTLGFQYSYYDSDNDENYEIKTKNFDNSISQKTTPDIFEIFEILQKISNDSGCAIPRDEELIINIEVSSHALDQGRLKYIPFRKAVLMNIGSDHIDYHKNIYEYEKSKFKIFDLVHKLGEKYIGIDTINKDGKAFKEYFANQKMPKSISFVDSSADIYCQINQPINSSKENIFKIIENKTLTKYHIPRPSRSSLQSLLSKDPPMTWNFVSRHPNEKVFINDKESVFHTDLLQKKHDCYGINMPVPAEGEVSYKIETQNPEREYICKIFPEFNIHNLVFGIIASFNPTEITADAFYFEWSARDVAYFEHGDDIDKFIGFRHPIILSERVKLPPGRTQIISNIPANVIIDFAHNAEGFDFFLSSIKEYYQKLVIVFGCGGDRDKEKRPKMLATAIKYGHKIIFTSDNSRSEKFEDIFNDASKGNNIKDVLIIEDRREAIIQGSQLIGNDDCLVILGKGHEQTQEINSNVMHFSDYEVVNEIYN